MICKAKATTKQLDNVDLFNIISEIEIRQEGVLIECDSIPG